MRELLLGLRDLCMLRIGPQDVPYAPTLLGGLIVAKLLLDAVVGAMLGGFGIALGASVITTVLVLGAVYVLLRMRSLQARFVQAGTAIVAATLAFSVLAIPAQFVLSPMPDDPAAFNGLQLAMLLLLAAIACWSLAVTAHILRNALEQTFFQGLMIALLISFGVAIVVSVMLPASA